MKRILSILLAILMLTTNMSITFATHYCGGKAVKSSISFGHDELSCGMAKMDEKAPYAKKIKNAFAQHNAEVRSDIANIF